MTLYLKDATYIDWKTLEFRSTHVAVFPGDGGGIRFLDTLPPESELSADDRALDCGHRLQTADFFSKTASEQAHGRSKGKAVRKSVGPTKVQATGEPKSRVRLSRLSTAVVPSRRSPLTRRLLGAEVQSDRLRRFANGRRLPIAAPTH